jgi:hypothetical protein
MRFLNACSKTIAVFLALGFILTALLALFLFNAQIWFMNPETYKSAFEEQEIYTQLPTLLAKQISVNMTYDPCLENPEECEGEEEDSEEDGGPPSYLKNLSQEQWETILSQLLTPEWTQAQTESLLDQIFDFVKSEEETITLTVSLVELKANLTGQKGLEIVRELIDAQPPCTEQLLDILFKIAAGDFTPDELLLCAPPHALLDNLSPAIESALDFVIQEIPDEATFEQQVYDRHSTDESRLEQEDSGFNIRQLVFIMRFSPLIPFMFFALVTFFGVRSVKDLFLWWGIPFAIVGLVGLALVLLGFASINWDWSSLITVRAPVPLEPSLVDFAFETLQLVFERVLWSIVIQVGVIAFIGIIFITLGILRKTPTYEDPLPQSLS